MTEWREARLRDICTGIFDCPHSTPALAKSGPYVVRTQDIRTGTFRAEEAAHVSEATYQERIARAEPSPGDLLFSREGTYFGVAAEVPHGTRLCLGQRMVLIRPNPSVADARFVRHWLNSPAMAAHIRGYRDGSVAERLNLPTIRNLPIALPPLSLQRRIADILGALDDKIALNARMASNLDLAARAIFRAKFAQGGPMPPEWRLTRLGDVAPTLLGGTPSRAEPRFWGGRIPWLNSGKANEFRVLEASDYITEAGLSGSATKLVPPRTTLVAITGATLGQTTVTEIGACINQSLVAILGTDDLPTEYLYFWLQERIGDLLASQTGAAQQHVNKNDVNALWIMVPPRPEIRDYIAIVRPMFDRIASAAFQSLTLAATRDALLPRLLSGRLAP